MTGDTLWLLSLWGTIGFCMICLLPDIKNLRRNPWMLAFLFLCWALVIAGVTLSILYYYEI